MPKIETTVLLEEYKKIERLVEKGRYKSPSDFFKKAVLRLIYEEFSKVELDRKTISAIKKALEDKKRKSKEKCSACGGEHFTTLFKCYLAVEYCNKCGTLRVKLK